MRQAPAEPTDAQLQKKVKQVFKKALEAVKEQDRPTLKVGKSFLENYYRENGRRGMESMLSKISLLVDVEGFEYLIELGLVKAKI